MGGKDRGIWGSTLEEGPREGILKRILGGKVWDKTFQKYGELKEVQKDENEKQDTIKRAIVSWEIGRGAKGHEG